MLNSYTAEDEAQITYVMCGLLAFNAFPGVLCGHIVDSEDAYMFAQINDGNAIALPFAKGFGWGAELRLQYIFEKLFGCESGGGYPKERVIPNFRNISSKTAR